MDPVHDPELTRLAETIGLSLQAGQVPLVVAEPADRDRFLEWFLGLVGGRVVHSRSAYPCSSFLESLDHDARVALLLEGQIPDDLFLMVRDYALDRTVPLVTRFGTHEIDPGHELILFVDPATVADMAGDLWYGLSQLTMLTRLSGEIQPQGMDDRVFPDPETATEWCLRYYGGGRFLFRGQTRDWPLVPALRRVPEESFERVSRSVLRLLSWLVDDNPLLGDTRLSEDEALAVAQHHGFKTPLLDLTRNVAVAAFFATHDADTSVDEPGVLYVFAEKELRDYLTPAEGRIEGMGVGLAEPTIKPLRRIRTQQGLFIESSPALLRDLVMARLRFRHKRRGQRIQEAVALPREFIYPPPSELERVVQAYALVSEATAEALGDPGDDLSLPEPTFDSGGDVVRTFLDEPRPEDGIPVYANQDAYAGALALTCSHLLVHDAAYGRAVFDATLLLQRGELTSEGMAEVRAYLRRLQAHLGAGTPTGIPEVPTLSIRDLVDGLALYHGLRGGNPDVRPGTIAAMLGVAQARLWNAYRCADHWLGPDAWELFPVVGAFALGCRQPIRAYFDALVAVGKGDGGALYRETMAEGRRWLEVSTGHDLVAVERVRAMIETGPLLARRLGRLDGWAERHPDSAERLGPFLYRLSDDEAILELAPAFTRLPGGQLAGSPHDRELAPAVAPLEIGRSVLEGLSGLTSTMRCRHEPCPFHRFRVCGRASVTPESPDDCPQRAFLEESLELSPETLIGLGGPAAPA